MGILKRIRQAFREPHLSTSQWRKLRSDNNADAARARQANDPTRQSPGAMTIRRWESAETTRLNSAHWSLVSDTSINNDLVEQLPSLRARCHWELQNNPMLAGVVATYTGDLVGPSGPNIEVESGSKEYDEWLEGHFRRWWRMPDLAGKLSGPEMVRVWMQQQWPDGEYFSQIVSDPEADGPVKIRLNNLHPRRIADPLGFIPPSNAELIMGILRDLFGRPLTYYVSEENTVYGTLSPTLKSNAVPAAQMLHGFNQTEVDQARGAPWLASQLQVAADARDYGNQVMDAARAAADSGVFMATTDPNMPAAKIDGNVTIDLERRRTDFMPPGWAPHMLKPEHPGTTYFDFLQEIYRQYGRPIGMPLLLVLLSSKGINYSGGRLDTQAYDRGLMVMRSIPEKSLTRLVELVAEEAELADIAAGKPVPARPDDVSISWGWQPRPHVDPAKEADAIVTLQESGNATVQDGLNRVNGRPVSTHIAMLQKEIEEYEIAGLVHPSQKPAADAAAAKSSDTANPDDDGQADDEEDEEDTEDAEDNDAEDETDVA